MRLQKGMQTTLPYPVTNTSLSYNLNYPILRYRSTNPGRSCPQEEPASILVIFSTTMQILLADWMTSMYLGWMASLLSASRLLQRRKVSCCMHFFSIISTVTSSPFSRRPYSKCISLQLTRVSPRTQSLICLPLCDCVIIVYIPT